MSDADPFSSQQFQETIWDGIMSCVTRALYRSSLAGQAKAVVTPDSKEATTTTESGEQSIGHEQPQRPSLVSWAVPVFRRNEIRYNLRKESSDARRLEQNGGESAKSQESWTIPQGQAKMCAQLPLVVA